MTDANIESKSNQPQSGISSLDDKTLLIMYRQMVLCRTLDERIWALNRQGKAAIVASSQGHEAAQIGSAWALRKGHDQFYIYYRDLAILLVLGMTPIQIMSGFLAKENEPLSGARQFPTHGAYPELGIVNLSNVVATQVPQAVGVALAMRMRQKDTVVITYFGDGASSMGDVHEAMNFASVHKLPVIFFCENNKYAISVPLSRQMAIESVASRGQAYGIPGFEVDGCDIVAVYEATAAAAQRARDGQGPTIIEANVERYLPHTSDDDDTKYRPVEEIKHARKRDPLMILSNQLRQTGALTEKVQEEIRRKAVKTVNEATEIVDSANYPGIDNFYDHVYAPEFNPH